MMNDNIILIGFMGSGKTFIGKNLAAQWEVELLDTDSYIEQQKGCTIAEIFAAEGETSFRQLETACLEALLADQQKKVIATGGGLPMTAANRPRLRQLGTIVYLQTSSAEVMRRLRGDNTRPLLKGGDTLNKIEQLMKQRIPVYEQIADIIINTEGKGQAAITEAIITAVTEKHRKT